MEELLVSEATKRNWKRLGVTEEEQKQKLSGRANKLYSKKTIIPKEYFENSANRKNVLSLIENIRNNKKAFDINKIIYNLALNLLLKNNLITVSENQILSKNTNILKVINDYGVDVIDKELLCYPLPTDETDILGIIYQTLMSEGNKNKKGSYYTPKTTVSDFLGLAEKSSIMLDPCCGTGGFLLRFADIIENPENLYGIDSDKTACFIASVNLILKYRDKKFLPKIFNCDFLLNQTKEFLRKKKFDIIVTNPPWGAFNQSNYSENFPQIKSKEIFSYFIIQAFNFLKNDGVCGFVLPISLLNVKLHRDIREFVLDNFHIKEIKVNGKIFSGVLTDVISIKLERKNFKEPVLIIDKDKKNQFISQECFLKDKELVFSLIGEDDLKLLEEIYSRPYLTLSDSAWGLGIVTGNNSKHISSKQKGKEKIYTGKEIEPYIMKESDKYIEYKREKFQQCAPDEIYRSEEKLLYKFISDKPVFAYDNEKRLVLNSANVLIPKIEGYSTKTVLAFLNSKIFRYIYQLKFRDVKVLRKNLEQLPFPPLNNSQRVEIDRFVDEYLNTQNTETLEKIDELVYSAFNINESYYRK